MPNMDEPWRRDEISQSQYYALKKVKFYVMYKKERKKVKVKVTLCDPMDCSLPDSSDPGIL